MHSYDLKRSHSVGTFGTFTHNGEFSKADNGGESGIRTRDTFRYTHFPGVRHRPLGHLSINQAGSLAELGGGRILLIFHLLPSFKKPFDRLASGQQLHGQDSIDPKHPFLMAFVAIGLHTQIIRALIRLLTNGHGGNHPFRFGIIGLKISKI